MAAADGPARPKMEKKQSMMFNISSATNHLRGAIMMGMFSGGEDAAEMAEEIDEAAYSRIIGTEAMGRRFATNYVSTTKYSVISFLPMSLLEQFKRMANVYFLLIAILCCIPAISPLLPWAAVAPVVFVLSISMTRDGIEDYYRYKADEELNNKEVWVLTAYKKPEGKSTMTTRAPEAKPAEFEKRRWKDIEVGDIVKIEDKGWIPADLLLLCTSGEDGSAFIDTMDLDGETNLKRRTAHPKSQHLAKDEMRALPEASTGLSLHCVPPSGDLYRFDGALRVYENADEAAKALKDPSAEAKAFPVDESNMLLRSARLRNIKWAVGIVVYTGAESKVMLNSKSGGTKQSALEKTMNTVIILIFFVQCVMSALTALLGGLWIKNHGEEHEYLHCESGPGGCSARGVGFLSFWTYVILLNSLIPSSLIVTMEVVKVVHAAFITWDRNMNYGLDDDGNWRHAKARTSALNEELGMIQFIFSDKTGTLTQNKMEFQQFSIRGERYSEAGGDKKKFQEFTDRVHLVDKKTTHFAKSYERTYARMLSMCHTVLLEEDKTPTGEVKVSYNADSPDEVALVKGGIALGYRFTGTGSGGMISVKDTAKDQVEDWEVLSIIQFSSHRKRMTIVARPSWEKNSGAPVHVWMKGADNFILDRCEFGATDATDKADDEACTEKLKGQLEEYAKEGLRTLCFAAKTMESTVHAEWQERWDKAAVLPPKERAVAFEGLATELEDKGFTLVGCSAIEDKLQENVPQTIVRLARAKIKLWVLTGDKQETAIEIGRATSLLVPAMKVHYLNCKSEAHLKLDLNQCYKAARKRKEKGEGPQALVIDGATLNFVMEGDKKGRLVTKEYSQRFIELAIMCQSVIVCRSSPLQKALIVMLVHHFAEVLEMPNVKSLAVGDGANDVPMIKSANIGIGIAGMEGAQASRAADYAVQQFQDLDRLLLQHGRLSYYRLATMSTYFFYKSWVFTLPQWIFGLYCARSGQTYYEALYVPSFNMFFTSLPVFIRAIVDQDIPENLALPLNPELYHVSQNNLLFDNPAIAFDFGMSIVHAYILFFLPYMGYAKDSQDLWTMSLSTYSIILATVTVRIIVATRTWTLYTVVAYSASILVYVAWLFFYDVAGVELSIRGAAPHLLEENGKFWPLLWLAIAATFVSETFMQYMKENSNPTNVDMVRQAKFDDIKIKAEECHNNATEAQAAGGVAPKKQSTGSGQRKGGYEAVANGEGGDPRWV